MPTARDKLIADWRDRLATAEAADTSSPSRPAWLARLQIRLYRFLLSIYGDAEWTTTPPQSSRRSPREPIADSGSFIFDSPDAVALGGAPTRSSGKIQAVLKSVANAQDAAPQTGPLLHGVSAGSWVIAASKTGNVDPTRLLHALQHSGIESRARACGSDVVVEVRAIDLTFALEIVRENREWLRVKRRSARSLSYSSTNVRSRESSIWCLFCLVLVVPQLLFGLIAVLTLGSNLFGNREPLFNFDPVFLQLWGAAALAALVTFLPISIVMLWHRRRSRPVVISSTSTTDEQP